MLSRLQRLVAPLRQPTLRRLTLSFLVNELGDGIAVMLLPLVVEASSGLGLLVGLAFAINRVAAVVGRPVGGILADRFDRHRVLRLSFVARGLLLATALWSGAPVVVVVCLVLASLGGSIDNASGEAAIREHAGDAPQEVAAIRKLSHAMSGVVGLAIGAGLFGGIGLQAALAADLGTYVVALVLMPRGPAPSWVRRTRPPRPPRAGWVAAVRRAIAASVMDAREGIAHLAGDLDLRVTAVGNTIMAGLVTALLTTAVVWLGEPGVAPDAAYGFALAAYSAGSILGLVVAGIVVWRVGVPTVVWRSLSVCGVICALGAVGGDWRVLALSWALWGLALGPQEVVTDTRLVQLTPVRLLGRSYAGLAMLAAIGQVVGGLVGGAMADLVDARLVIVGLGLALVVAGLAVRAWVGRATTEAIDGVGSVGS